jgi:hypothetical protein
MRLRGGAANGDAFHAANVSALVDLAKENADELTPELGAMLERVAALTAQPVLPQPTLVDTLEPPQWSYATALARMPAWLPGASG